MSVRALPALLGASILTGCSPRPVEVPSVLLIAVDTLRADHLSCYGYERETSPNIDGLAARSVRYANAYSPAPWTRPAMASILTGWYPSTHTFDQVGRDLPEEVPTLAERFSDEGFVTGMINSNVLLRRGSGLGQGFEVYQDAEARGHEHVSTPGVTNRAVKFLEQRAEDEQPFFLSLLYFDPHYAYLDHPGIDFAKIPTGRIESGQSIHHLRKLGPDLRPAEVQTLLDLYDEEIRFTDRGIGRLLRRLEDLELASSTVIVLTADHGEEFFEHGWLGHTRNLYDDLLHVPLVLHDPRSPENGNVVTDSVTTVSIAATLNELCELGAARLAFQAPALPRLDTGAPFDLYAEVDFYPVKNTGEDKRAKMRSLRRRSEKLIWDELTPETLLFDMEEDPGELRDLAVERSEVASELRFELDQLVSALGTLGVTAGATSAPSASDLEALRALGYAGEE